MKTAYIAAGLLLLLAISRNANASAAGVDTIGPEMYGGVEFDGDRWSRLFGDGLGGAPNGVNECQCFCAS